MKPNRFLPDPDIRAGLSPISEKKNGRKKKLFQLFLPSE